jgi:phospholipid N-methyltransferase
MKNASDNKRRSIPKWLLFARNFLRFPAMLGSLVPSSPFLVNDLLSQIDWQRGRVIVEFGPGVGTFTHEILRRMRPDAVLIAIELNEEFVRYLQEQITDPRLRVIHGSASDVRSVMSGLGIESADYIISGIPYSTIPDAARRHILEQSRNLLAADGALLIYQFTGTVRPYLESSFRWVRQDIQLLNVLPARIFYCIP